MLRLAIDLPPDVKYGDDPRGGYELALLPDGTRLVFAADQNGQRMLYLRDLREGDTRPIRGSEDAMNPFFSPDGEWLVFFHAPVSGSDARLKKIAIRGGTPSPSPRPHIPVVQA